MLLARSVLDKCSDAGLSGYEKDLLVSIMIYYYVNNLFDETYYEGLSDANNLLYGAPRSFTVGMKYSF